MAGVLLGRMDRRAVIEVPGGSLDVSWDADSGHVSLAGPAVPVFSGVVRDRAALH